MKNINFDLWYQYFFQNQTHFSSINFSNETQLSDKEKGIITTSLQQFQRGEYSEGKHLFKLAYEMENDDYMKTIKLFIKEEQDHAMILGKFMKREGISPIRRHWVDTAFRRIRKLAGLELSLVVLTTAELIAAVYYKALFHATKSDTLKSICEQILIDEEMHINFQAFTLSFYRKKRGFKSSLISNWVHRIFVMATVVLVFFTHKKVLNAGGYKFMRFHEEVLWEFERFALMESGKLNNKIKWPEKLLKVI